MALWLKAEIMVDHFHEQVLALNKIGGKARAMVVTSGIARAIQYYHAIRQYLLERKSPYRAIVAFSGEHEYGEVKVSEVSLNAFPSGRIADEIQRFLICADKFQTGYDEPLSRSSRTPAAYSRVPKKGPLRLKLNINQGKSSGSPKPVRSSSTLFVRCWRQPRHPKRKHRPKKRRNVNQDEQEAE